TPTTPEKDLLSRRAVILDWETGYNHQQETRPQTLGVAMADSPVGAAGWILEKFGKWADLPTTADGSPDIWSKFSEEQLLTNIMLYVAHRVFLEMLTRHAQPPYGDRFWPKPENQGGRCDRRVSRHKLASALAGSSTRPRTLPTAISWPS